MILKPNLNQTFKPSFRFGSIFVKSRGFDIGFGIISTGPKGSDGRVVVYERELLEKQRQIDAGGAVSCAVKVTKDIIAVSLVDGNYLYFYTFC